MLEFQEMITWRCFKLVPPEHCEDGLNICFGQFFCDGYACGSDGRHFDPEMEIISKAEAEDLLGRDQESSKWWVSRLVKRALNENRFSDLTLFTFKVGTIALQRSSPRMKLNREEAAGKIPFLET